jgi:hypothetical protein
MVPQFAGRVEPFGLCLHAQPEQILDRFVQRERQLLIAHVA